jgi:peptidoglycan glycosyltransferase
VSETRGERKRVVAGESGRGSRWREAQRRRRASLSPRGRATLVLASALLVGFVVAALTLSRAPVEADPPAPAAVSAPPPPEPPDAPRSLLERLPVDREALEFAAVGRLGAESGPVGEKGVDGRLFEYVPWQAPGVSGPLRVEYTLDAELTRDVFRVLRQGRVALGHVILLDPHTGRVLAYASTDPETFPPTRAYPAASLVKVITAAAVLDASPETATIPCRFSGSPYKLTRRRLDPPRSGNTVSLRKALATSNNQCFAQLAVHALGGERMLDAIERFGWLSPPAPAHQAGSVDPGEDRFDLGRLGCGLAGSRITPLHAAQLAASLAEGELVTPRWVERVLDAQGRELPLPARPAPRRVMSPELAEQLRGMLVDTTTRGTARSAFRDRRHRPLLGELRVAGKTGSLSGHDPTGRYEWFIGVAPARDPKLVVATLLVQGDLYWRTASQISAEVLRRAFCPEKHCSAESAERWLHPRAATAVAGRSREPQGS